MGLYIRNAYHLPIVTAIIYPQPYCKDRGDNYAKMGWWTINPNETKFVLAGNLMAGWAYCVHGHTIDRTYLWGNKYNTKCPNSAFDLCYQASPANGWFIKFLEFRASQPNMTIYLHI
jgi:hypothetical protein